MLKWPLGIYLCEYIYPISNVGQMNCNKCSVFLFFLNSFPLYLCCMPSLSSCLYVWVSGAALLLHNQNENIQKQITSLLDKEAIQFKQLLKLKTKKKILTVGRPMLVVLAQYQTVDPSSRPAQGPGPEQTRLILQFVILNTHFAWAFI